MMSPEIVMSSRRRAPLFIFLLALPLVLPVFGQKPTAAKSVLRPAPLLEKDLPPKYRSFLTLVTYIIIDKEKDVFLQLSNDRDRDIFIESFWKLRDPTPGTAENEFKIEHIQRFEYANTILGRGSTRPGWMTDRGKFHIILGKPSSIDRYDSTLGVRPCEVWSYYTDGAKGMPLHFGLVFFQKGGTGDYRLYDPFIDGPRALMSQTPEASSIDSEDYSALYDRLMDIAPALADFSISLIPGEYGIGFTPSPRNALLIAEILDSPKVKLRPTYATHFLDYKGLVSTEYMSNYVDSEGLVAVLPEPTLGMSFIHFAVKPLQASVDYYAAGDQYFSTFAISVSLRKPGPEGAAGEVVYQYTRDLPFYFPAGEEAKVRSNGVSVEDVFPAVPGAYKLSVLLQNAVGMEFSVYETDLVVPEPPSRPRLTPPLFGYRSQDTPSGLVAPFLVGAKKILIDPKNLYGQGDQISLALIAENAAALRESGSVRVVFRAAGKTEEVRKSIELRLRDLPPGRDIPVLMTFPARDLPPDYYEVQATLLDGAGKPQDARTGQVIVSMAEKIGHPIPDAKGVPLANRHLMLGLLARQSAGLRRDDQADAYYRRVFEIKPDFAPGLAEYAQFLLGAGRLDRCLEIIERIQADSGLRFQYHSIRGKALLGQKKYAPAEASLLEAVRIYNSDTSVLNALGDVSLRLRKKAEAVEALKASLRLNPDQEEAKALLAEAEKLK
jgi:GWxTD domain-containing protein